MAHEKVIHGKVRQVGNSVAIFVSAEERDKYQLFPETELILTLNKKKVVKSVFGTTKGKIGRFSIKDRADWHDK